MKILNGTEGEVELNDREAETTERLNLLINMFHLPEDEALDQALDQHKGKPSKAFVEWLSQGTRTIDGGALVKVVDVTHTKAG